MKQAYNHTFSQRVASNFDWLFQRVNDGLLHVNPRSFIDITTTEGKHTLIMRDGTLCTAIKLHGSTRDIRYEEYVEILSMLESSFKTYFMSGDHYFSWTFKSDPENVDEAINRMWTNQAHEVASRLELDIHDIIKEMHQVHADSCQDESVYLLVWTNIHMSTKQEKKLHAERSYQYTNGVPRHTDAQKIQYTAPAFYERHRATCQQIVIDLKNVHIRATVTDAHEFLRDLRISVDETFTNKDWEPRVPGDPINYRLLSDNKADLSGLFHDPLPSQLMPRGISHKKEGILQSGDVYYAPISVAQHPKSPTPFDALLVNITKARIPFRMHMLIKNDGMNVFGMKVMFARFISFSGSEKNKRLIETFDYMEELSRRGEEIVSSQISFCTWSRNLENFNEIRERRSTLVQKIKSWGNIEVSAAEGDEAETFLSSIGGMTLGSVADAAAAPLYDSLKMAPIARMGSAWEVGSKLYVTHTGKLIPYMPYSKQQLAWVKFIVGPMGSGKTVHLNGEHFALLLHPDNQELPFILNIDVGPGMKGFCSMVRDALPKHKKHQVIYEKLLNRKESAINAFDTPLGIRRPFSNQVSYLQTYLSMICCEDKEATPPEGGADVINMLIDLVYEYRSNRDTAREYAPGISPRVDEYLEHLDITTANIDTRKITWWDVVDFLSSKGEYHAASIAQRYASPTLEDVASRVTNSRIQNTFSKLQVDSTKENICEFIQRKITAALNRYPIMSGHTCFDIGDSRIVSLDLDEVGKGVGPSAARQLSLMYFLAFFTLTKRVFTGRDLLPEISTDESGLFPFNYYDYHAKQVASIERTPKRFSGDEIHRFKDDPMAKQLQALSIREGRKWKVDIVQASQLSEDFHQNMIDLATDIVILGRGNRSNIKNVVEHFNLPSNLEERLTNGMKKPSKEGSTIVMTVEASNARYEQYVYSKYGPTFLWSTTSTQDDRIVRDSLSEKLGTSRARSLLVELYPAGNLDDEIDDRRRREQLLNEAHGSETVSSIDEKDETPQHILDDIVNDALRHYDKMLIVKAKEQA